jgi:hypothetical protein
VETTIPTHGVYVVGVAASSYFANSKIFNRTCVL